ncbi:MAG: PqqD family protein [Alphaproteobacteria bacterium]|nr:PqqD family protein [Alphaproteobacteria bacterium]MCB9699797.1 PqqD family protein [Alphaproteobacteria bacterium]
MSATWRRHPRVVLRGEGDGAIALHLDTQQYFELNGSARTVWDALEDGVEADHLASRLIDVYGIERGEAEEVVDELLTALLREGLVVLDGERRRDRWRRRLLGR